MNRSVDETLEIGWDLFSILPEEELNCIDENLIAEHYRKDGSEVAGVIADD